MAGRKPDKIVLTNVNVWWWNLAKMNEMAGKYTVDVGPLGAKEVEKLKAAGMTVAVDKEDSKTKGERGTYVTLKTKENKFIRLLDADNNPLDIKEVEVGNGSTAHVQIQPFEWTFKAKSGVSAGPDTIKLLKIVPVPRSDKDPFAEEDAPVGDDDVPF